MSGDSWDWVIDGFNQSWENHSTVLLLELLGHIITDLTDAVESSVSNLGVGVLQVSQHDWDHSSDVLDIVNVLTNLRESH